MPRVKRERVSVRYTITLSNTELTLLHIRAKLAGLSSRQYLHDVVRAALSEAKET
jgi:hypothetical protein